MDPDGQRPCLWMSSYKHCRVFPKIRNYSSNDRTLDTYSISRLQWGFTIFKILNWWQDDLFLLWLNNCSGTISNPERSVEFRTPYGESLCNIQGCLACRHVGSQCNPIVWAVVIIYWWLMVCTLSAFFVFSIPSNYWNSAFELLLLKRLYCFLHKKYTKKWPSSPTLEWSRVEPGLVPGHV